MLEHLSMVPQKPERTVGLVSRCGLLLVRDLHHQGHVVNWMHELEEWRTLTGPHDKPLLVGHSIWDYPTFSRPSKVALSLLWGWEPFQDKLGIKCPVPA